MVQSGVACLHVDRLTSLNTESTPTETHEKWGMRVCVCVEGVCVVGGEGSGGGGGGHCPNQLNPCIQ